MLTISQISNIYEQMVKCYRNIYGINITDIFLYGSYARGDYNDESDMDIVAIVKGSRSELQQKLTTIWDFSAEVGLENDIIISPAVIPYDEFEKYKDKLPYYMNIYKEGLKIG